MASGYWLLGWGWGIRIPVVVGGVVDMIRGRGLGGWEG